MVPLFEWPGRWEAYLVLITYTLALLLILWRQRRDFTRLRGRRLLLFILLIILTYPLNRLLVVHADPDLLNLLSPPYLAADPLPPSLPLLGLLPVTIAAVWVGAGPATLIGLLVGIIRVGTTSHSLLEIFTPTFESALIAYFLQQEYRGRLFPLLRQPVLALPTAAVAIWPLALCSTFCSVYFSTFYQAGSELAVFDYAWTLQRFAIGLGLLEAMVQGLLLQAIFILDRALPDHQLRPRVTARRPPPYATSLSRRFLFSLLPIFVLLLGVLIYAVARSAVNLATQQAVDALLRDGTNGTEEISSFISTGQSLIRQFAADATLWEGDEAACRARLRSDLQMLPYFNRLTAYGSSGEVLCTYPSPSQDETALTSEEQELQNIVQTTGALLITPVHRGSSGRPIISFQSPLEDLQGETRHGVLVGRVDIEVSPLIKGVLDGLQETMGEGEGFIVNADGRIIAHPNPERILEYWAINESSLPLSQVSGGRGWVSQSRDSLTNARQLSCYVRAEGHPWTVVILLPHEVVLGLATNIAGPLLVLLVTLTGVIGVVILLVTNQLTRPLNLLASAAGQIAAGRLDQPIHVEGVDEVAQLGDAFDKMRVGLKERLDDLSLLLRVSQEVSATLDLAKGMAIILEAALKATGATISRVVLLSAGGEPQVVMGRGDGVDGLANLDRTLALNCQDTDHPLRIENVARAPSLIGASAPPDGIRAAIALPVRSKGRTVAVIWIGYPKPRRFTSSEVRLLSTLASQAAVLVENARLFQEAEGGRRRLAAILASTRDAILVTDRDNRLLLINPAAEQALGLKAEEVLGERIEDVPTEEVLIEILTEPMSRTGSLVEEVPLPSGHTFYASASTILSADGENMGRVVSMRDITYFKELDEMKSEFVATVSHDLRAPLTFMRGYATMLPMVGGLTEKQELYLDKILTGIEQTAGLVEDLLNLGRIEAGVGLEEEPCHVGVIVLEAVDNMRTRAAAKGLTLKLEPSDPAPVIQGDPTLLRQAIANLVDNAIKYTPTGGLVTVGLESTETELLVNIRDTGIGIAPEDQVRLFEKFFRIRRRETENVSGTGLGLALVKSIVERHGGRVSVESTVNEGSTFTIALPIREPSKEAKES
ncbi:MAG: ATP-binding protein [Anaerolineae bacterium]|jgi:PAS domain S-box-containing protein